MNKITPINLEDKPASHGPIEQAAHHSALTPDSFAESAKGKTGFYRIIKATGYSLDGFKAAYKFEAAFRQVVWLNLVLLAAVIVMPFALGIKMMLVVASFLSLIVELLNTGIEACVDHTSTAKHPLAKIAKDVGSAAQFLSLCLLLILWVMALSVLFY
ncbi:diacylglycerol kinase [Psychrobacter sp. 4Dc]|nr:diacylglycerol kinase [Psychrobacter sp. 4Dc]PKH65679.1 diacylglycerol kinase [Psychrobacter sp. 4Dc]